MGTPLPEGGGEGRHMGSQGQRRTRGLLVHRAGFLFAVVLAAGMLLAAVAGTASAASLASAWWLNDDGQLGNGSTSGPSTCKFNAVLHACSLGAIPVSELSEVTAVAAGKDHSLAIVEGGTVMAWGRNSSGQLGNGTTTGSALPVAVGGLSEVTAIAAGTDHSLALRADGTVAWRAAHSDVVTEAQLVAGRLDLTTYSGVHLYLDARTGEEA